MREEEEEKTKNELYKLYKEGEEISPCSKLSPIAPPYRGVGDIVCSNSFSIMNKVLIHMKKTRLQRKKQKEQTKQRRRERNIK
jgi:hypothetical protein